MTPQISILLPVWNAAATLSVCLRSIRRQRNTEWECIILDDGSTDDSCAIAQSFAGRDGRFRVAAGERRGLIRSLNAGIELCRAPIVARMDADDWMHRDRLCRQLALLADRPDLDAVGCWTRSFPRRTLRDGHRNYEAWLNELDSPERIWRERFIESPIAHPTLAIRRETLAQFGYRDRNWPEDYDLLLRLLRKGPCVGIVGQRLLGWRDGSKRLSRTDARYALDRFTACRAWHLHRDFLSEASEYILWGHGPTGRALRRALAELGHRAALIVDVHPRRVGNTIDGARVVAPRDLPNAPAYPLIASVAGLGPRSEIRADLDARGLREGFEYVCAA